MWKKNFYLLLVLTQALACQTVPPPISVNVPLVYQEGFDSCMGQDGSIKANLYRNEELAQSLPFDWISYVKNGWVVESTSPLGQTLFRLNYQRKTKDFRMSGGFPHDFPFLSIDEKNYLEIEGRRIGLKADEIPCVLSGHIPLSWLDQLTDWQETREEIKFQASDEFRTIQTRMQIDEQGSVSFCNKIKWSYYLGFFQHEIHWCSGHLITTVRGIDNFRLELLIREEV